MRLFLFPEGSYSNFYQYDNVYLHEIAMMHFNNDQCVEHIDYYIQRNAFRNWTCAHGLCHWQIDRMMIERKSHIKMICARDIIMHTRYLFLFSLLFSNRVQMRLAQSEIHAPFLSKYQWVSLHLSSYTFFMPSSCSCVLNSSHSFSFKWHCYG